MQAQVRLRSGAQGDGCEKGAQAVVDISDLATSRNLVELLLRRADAGGDQPFLWAKRDGEWRSISWAEAARQVCLIAESLRAMGLGQGDRVMLVAENRPEWCIADFAIMAAGCLTVPAYVTNTERDHQHILEDSGASAVIVANDKLAKPLLGAVLRSGQAKHVIGIEPLRISQIGPFEYHDWQALAAGDAAAARAAVDARIAGIGRDDIACLIYTSGTGGHPRGVMQTHGGILSNCLGAWHLLELIGLDDEVFLSFLPLSHAYEHTAGQWFPLTIAAQIYYAESIEALTGNLVEVHPTIMTAVPRLYEVLHQRITRDLRRRGGWRARLFERTVVLGRRRHDRGRLGPLSWLEDRLLDRLVRRQVRQRFGGRLKAMVSGGAPLNPEIGRFFDALGLRVLQGYGQTEASPVISCNRPDRPRFDSVGPALAGVELRIAADGEIVLRGELVMKGYWNDPEGTAAALQDGWLHTGDIGRIDPDGAIVITDRKKDIIVNSGGDNIAPQRIEGMLNLEPEIAQSMVLGDRRPYLVGLIVPDADFAAAWARRHDRPAEPAALAKDEDFRRAIGAAVDRVNRTLGQVERVRQFLLAPEPFTVDNGQMTPTMKIRRHALRARYGAELERLYGGGG